MYCIAWGIGNRRIHDVFINDRYDELEGFVGCNRFICSVRRRRPPTAVLWPRVCPSFSPPWRAVWPFAPPLWPAVSPPAYVNGNIIRCDNS